LISIAKEQGAKGSIYYQEEALGTAHAVLCAGPSLKGKTIVAFADTLFKAEFKIEDDCEASIWVQKVDNPSSFGVVKLNDNGYITDFIEKPQNFVSDLAIIGIYYFASGEDLKNELQALVDNKQMVKGEYQLTDALENLKNKGTKFTPGQVSEWLDCGNKDATVYTNQRILEYLGKEKELINKALMNNSVIIQPCFIDSDVKITNSVIGPHVSIGKGTVIDQSVISNSIIQANSKINHANFSNSMIGNFAEIQMKAKNLSIGDYNQLKD